jgi:hypothetical protein
MAGCDRRATEDFPTFADPDINAPTARQVAMKRELAIGAEADACASHAESYHGRAADPARKCLVHREAPGR